VQIIDAGVDIDGNQTEDQSGQSCR